MENNTNSSPAPETPSPSDLSNNYQPRKRGRPRKGEIRPPAKPHNPRKVTLAERATEVLHVDKRGKTGEIVAYEDGAVHALGRSGQVVARLNTAELAQAILRAFRGYEGIAESLLLLYRSAKNEGTKIKAMALMIQVIKTGETRQEAPRLDTKNKDELQRMLVEKVTSIASQSPEMFRQLLDRMAPDSFGEVQEKLTNAKTGIPIQEVPIREQGQGGTNDRP